MLVLCTAIARGAMPPSFKLYSPLRRPVAGERPMVKPATASEVQHL